VAAAAAVAAAASAAAAAGPALNKLGVIAESFDKLTDAVVGA
jgi:hypothetical protein